MNLIKFVFLTVLCAAYLFHKCLSFEERKFSMGKINAVWTKAQKVLEGKRLAELYADLVVQDKREKELKKRLHDGTDNDGLFEARVRKDFIDIIKKYDLSEYFPSAKYASVKNDLLSSGEAYPIKDEKLKTILKSALKQGFSDMEMKLLKEEMSHYQLKLDEYESLKQDYESLEEQVDNSLDNLEKQEDVWKELAQKKKDMKERHKEFRDGLKRLENKLGDSNKDAAEFENPKVYELWALAQKAGMTEEELESIKTELHHFENRIQKAEFVQGQVDKAEKKRQLGEHVDLKEHEELQERARHFSRKVDKYHKDISDRIHRKLDEL